ncbi:MAG TPA: helix-turn-helix transcriptional regulator [Thermoanaerobaculia bacterium]|nr:helix-turn-helix transcriptional regulator [Thermoanaerobaculia bacterium]
MSTRYREYAPPADLRDWVQCIWTMDSMAPGPRSHRVLPDGCIDILFEVAAGSAVESFVVGMMTRPLVVERLEPSRITAVRFKPGGAAAFWRGPLHRLTDARVELREVWPCSAELADRLAQVTEMTETAAEAGRIELLVGELRRRLDSNGGARRWHAGCRQALHQLARRPETGVRELCAQLGVSRQALARSFREHVGVPPKTLARVLRLQQALRLIERSHGAVGARGGGRRWSFGDLAADAGFYDQPHMIAEWRQLVGLTPTGFLAERTAATGGVPFFQDSAS